MDAAEPATHSAHTQFDFADSDIVLHSSDNVLFRVHKANLAAFSAVFRNMFSDVAGQEQPGPEVVPVSELASTLEILLAMCYPSEEPPIDLTVVDARIVLACYEAAVKYQMWVAGLALRSFVQPLVYLEPFLVVKLAHRLRDSVLMTAAAEETLKSDILAKSREYAAKAGPDVWPALLEFHYRRKMELIAVAKAVFASDEASDGVACPGCARKPKPPGTSDVAERKKSLEDIFSRGPAAFDAAPLLQWINDQNQRSISPRMYRCTCGRQFTA